MCLKMETLDALSPLLTKTGEFAILKYAPPGYEIKLNYFSKKKFRPYLINNKIKNMNFSKFYQKGK